MQLGEAQQQHPTVLPDAAAASRECNHGNDDEDEHEASDRRDLARVLGLEQLLDALHGLVHLVLRNVHLRVDVIDHDRLRLDLRLHLARHLVEGRQRVVHLPDDGVLALADLLLLLLLIGDEAVVGTTVPALLLRDGGRLRGLPRGELALLVRCNLPPRLGAVVGREETENNLDGGGEGAAVGITPPCLAPLRDSPTRGYQ